MSAYLLWLKDNYDANLVGNKAAHLYKLAHMGCDVPPFFCVTNQAYLDFLKKKGLLTYAKKFHASDMGPRDVRYFSSMAREIRHSILSQALPPEIEEEITHALKEFKSQRGKDLPLAVRSSGIEEDMPGFSMAGQLKTFLNLLENSSVTEKIKECWASLWEESVIRYLAIKGGREEIPTMGIIIQEMVISEMSGVLFTINPVNRKNEIIIEAIWGLCPPLVGGRVNPDRYTVDKESLNIHIDSSKNQETMALIDREKEGFVMEIPVPKQKRQKRVLGDSQIKILSQLAMKIEEDLKSPQDMEWAFEGERVYLIQSRPLTLPKKAPTEKETPPEGAKERKRGKEEKGDLKRIWTKRFFDERFQKPVSPLGWSILKDLLERRAFIDPLKYMGFQDAHRIKITKLFYGRPYTNLLVFYRLFTYYPSFLISGDTERFFPSKEFLPYKHRRLPWISIRFLYSIFKTLIKDRNWIIPVHLKKWESFLKEYLKSIQELQDQDLDNLSHKELFSNFTKTRNLVSEFLKIHRWSITYADILYHFSLRLVKRWGLDERLLTGSSSKQKNLTMEIDREIKELARMISLSDILRHFFMEYEYPLLLEKLNETKEGQNFLKRFRTFLNRYGHRSNSLDISCPTWKEDRGYIIDVLKKMIDADILEQRPDRTPDFDPEKEIKGSLGRGFLNKLFPLRFLFFKKLVSWTKTFILLRENQRFYWQISMFHIRKNILEMAKRLTGKNESGIRAIDTADDIFFLKIQEVYDLLMQEAKKTDYRDVIANRRYAWSYNSSIDAPAFILSEDHEEREFPADLEKEGIFKGLGASPGTITGNACVMRELEDYNRLKKGDILVTKSIDPGWVHILSMASGLILEVGGLLSHGSIIARELGIPSVVNIDKATIRIPSGRKILLNGTEGYAELME